jgi:hypothetical protein
MRWNTASLMVSTVNVWALAPPAAVSHIRAAIMVFFISAFSDDEITTGYKDTTFLRNKHHIFPTFYILLAKRHEAKYPTCQLFSQTLKTAKSALKRPEYVPLSLP